MSRIAVLFHKRDLNPGSYIIHQLAEIWAQMGHEVIYLFGTRRYVPADVLIVHVNMSVVPRRYIAFADRYPRVINRHVNDIRKRRVSRNLVTDPGTWSGPVIVKSDLNYGGTPERRFARWRFEDRWPLLGRIRTLPERFLHRNRYVFRDPGDYLIFESAAEVPNQLFADPGVVVEKFLPELEAGRYCTRSYQVLGKRWICTRFISHNPIVKASSSERSEQVTPPPEIEHWCHAHGLEYGKIDYVMHGGEPVILDVNKTTGASTALRTEPEFVARRQYLAEGISDYLP